MTEVERGIGMLPSVLRLLTNPTFFGAWGFVFLGTGSEGRGEQADRFAAQSANEAQQGAHEWQEQLFHDLRIISQNRFSMGEGESGLTHHTQFRPARNMQKTRDSRRLAGFFIFTP
ncbi:hypothetical protein WL28_28550 [Burkholderia ubonensis]|uniref:hypothetical protein n=1 Tax=Burkholderia ubonensis TaxID=101571 RepID=UPI000756690F|nr:hypothetical protein [Burkholderia ubonensis]KVT28651.1 hypothetical protein WK48_16495 [Burkholderia ubonensis]KWA78035.1 hypothetical protein WL28_28550 [Burkholderia ubonensis]OJB13726.1 hypothetical protein BGV54_27735 [Burkholderia ubonensis]